MTWPTSRTIGKHLCDGFSQCSLEEVARNNFMCVVAHAFSSTTEHDDAGVAHPVHRLKQLSKELNYPTQCRYVKDSSNQRLPIHPHIITPRRRITYSPPGCMNRFFKTGPNDETLMNLIWGFPRKKNGSCSHSSSSSRIRFALRRSSSNSSSYEAGPTVLVRLALSCGLEVVTVRPLGSRLT